MDYEADFRVFTKWSREDNPPFWFVDALGLQSEAYVELDVTIDLLLAQYTMQLPLNFMDLSPLEMYYLSSDENDLYCFGMFYFYNFFNLIPKLIENTMECHYSLLEHIIGAIDSTLNIPGVTVTNSWDFNSFDNIFKCTTGETDSKGAANSSFYNTNNEHISTLSDFGFEWVKN